ncbi:hypothetical protein Tco_1191457 [Tanacetum coccineum]
MFRGYILHEALNITMEEYIRLEEEKARRHDRTFNWETATFGKVENYEDENDCFIDFETEFPAIVFDNTLTAIQSEPTVCPPNENMIDFRISLDESDDKDYTVIFDENSFSYKIIAASVLKTDSENDNNNMPWSPNPTYDYFNDLDCFKDFENEFPIIVYNDCLTSKSDMAPLPAADQRYPWLRYQVEGYTEGIRHSYEQRLETIWSRPVNQVHVLDFEGLTPKMRQDLAVRLRMIDPNKEDLRDYWIEISSGRDFLGPAPSYVIIRDLVRRLCHRMIAYSISDKGQAPEKVTGVDLFYLRSMDRVTINVPHLLAQYLFRYTKRRKSGARLLGGHFIGRLAMHFGLVSNQGLRGLQEPERQQATTVGAHEADKACLAAKEVVEEIPALVQAPPPPALQPRTMSQRIERVEEEVHDLRRDGVGLRGVVESFTTKQSRVSTWLISCMTQLMDASGQTYQPFDSTLVGSSWLSFQRRVRPRTGNASTSAAPHTDAQPDP